MEKNTELSKSINLDIEAINVSISNLQIDIEKLTELTNRINKNKIPVKNLPALKERSQKMRAALSEAVTNLAWVLPLAGL